MSGFILGAIFGVIAGAGAMAIFMCRWMNREHRHSEAIMRDLCDPGMVGDITRKGWRKHFRIGESA